MAQRLGPLGSSQAMGQSHASLQPNLMQAAAQADNRAESDAKNGKKRARARENLSLASVQRCGARDFENLDGKKTDRLPC